MGPPAGAGRPGAGADHREVPERAQGHREGPGPGLRAGLEDTGRVPDTGRRVAGPGWGGRGETVPQLQGRGAARPAAAAPGAGWRSRAETGRRPGRGRTQAREQPWWRGRSWARSHPTWTGT